MEAHRKRKKGKTASEAENKILQKEKIVDTFPVFSELSGMVSERPCLEGICIQLPSLQSVRTL